MAALESVLAFIEAYDVAAIDASEGDELVGDVALSVALSAAKTAKQKPVKRRKRPSDVDSSCEDGGKNKGGGTTSYTTILQRRKRAEVQTLREQVQELEAHLARLQGARWGAQSSSKKSESSAAPSAPQMHLMPSVTSRVRLSDLWESVVGEACDVQMKVPQPFGPAMAVKGNSKWLDSAVTQYRLRRRSELKNRQLKQLMSQQMHLNTSILRLMQKRSLFPVRATTRCTARVISPPFWC